MMEEGAIEGMNYRTLQYNQIGRYGRKGNINGAYYDMTQFMKMMIMIVSIISSFFFLFESFVRRR